MGYWVDLDAPYITYENEYIESVWALLQVLHQKGLLYRGHKIQWYSPANETVLSSHEVSLGYEEVQDPSIIVRAPLADEPGHVAPGVDDDAVDRSQQRRDVRRAEDQVRQSPRRLKKAAATST